jgi:hypothetical protein
MEQGSTHVYPAKHGKAFVNKRASNPPDHLVDLEEEMARAGGNQARKRTEDNNEARLDELGSNPGQVGPDSAGQSGDPQGLSIVSSANDESVEELADTDQAMEAASVEGAEDAADHPERPVHTHQEYGRPDDLPPKRGSE